MPQPLSEDKRLEWKNLIEQQRKSGLSIEKWCLKNQIRPHTFHYWKEKLSPKPLNRSSFAEVSLKRNAALTIECRGLRLRIDNECDPLLRKQILLTLLDPSC